MNKIVSMVVENQLFPLINWIKFSFSSKYIILLAGEPYKKMSFRNRYVLAGSNGLITLTVPLEKGRNQKVLFKQVRIFKDGKWQLTHWRTITSCYNKTPYFEHYASALEKLFTDKYEFLFEWNFSILQWLKDVLKFPAELIVLDKVPEDAEDFRDKWRPKNFQDDPLVTRYPQIFEARIGFQNNLSILDMLFNVGPNAAKLLGHSS